MRYGCDPLSIGLLDLWRQSDDETMFELTGRSLLDLVDPSGDRVDARDEVERSVRRRCYVRRFEEQGDDLER